MEQPFQRILERARELGFIAAGFTRPGRPLFFKEFKAWLRAGMQGGMSWLENRLYLREDPSRLLEGCRTIICLAFPYPSKAPSTPEGYTVSRYAQPFEEDYHRRLRRKGRELVLFLETIFEGSRSRICVDSAPLMERSFAYSAGLGFIGKNNALIVPGHGSWVYLAEILTTADIAFPAVDPLKPRCGTCSRCIEACPTGALEAPNRINASRCLSYLSIEYKGEIPPEYGEKMGRCFFGCDRCQEVCPFNEGGVSEIPSLPPIREWLEMTEKAFQARFGPSALSRVSLSKLKRNIQVLTRRKNLGHNNGDGL